MSAAIMREAAALMRQQHGPSHERHLMWSAMAGWLDNAAKRSERSIGLRSEFAHAEVIARAYLGTQP